MRATSSVQASKVGSPKATSAAPSKAATGSPLKGSATGAPSKGSTATSAAPLKAATGSPLKGSATGAPSKGSTATSSAPKSSGTREALSCQMKKPQKGTIAKRVLEERSKRIQGGRVELGENEWISSDNVRRGDTVAVVNLSGCTAVFLWDSNNIPSVFHILCGHERYDAAEAYRKVYELRLERFTHISIAASGQRPMDDADAGLRQCSQDSLPIADDEPYYKRNLRLDLMERYRLEVTAGDPTRTVRRTKYIGAARQPQQPQGSYYNQGGQGGQGGRGSQGYNNAPPQDPYYDQFETGYTPQSSSYQGSSNGGQSSYQGGREYYQGGNY